MKERVVIVFIAIAIGLLVTTLIFFLYQQTKTIPQRPINAINDKSPSPTPKNSAFLTIDTPADEALSSKRSIEVKGRTNPENTIIVSTNQEDEVVRPTTDGKFSVTITIDPGSNKIITRAIAPNGDEQEDSRVITFNTEEF